MLVSSSGARTARAAGVEPNKAPVAAAESAFNAKHAAAGGAAAGLPATPARVAPNAQGAAVLLGHAPQVGAVIALPAPAFRAAHNAMEAVALVRHAQQAVQ